MTVQEIFQRVLSAVGLVLIEAGARPTPIIIDQQLLAQTLGLRERLTENLLGRRRLPLG